MIHQQNEKIINMCTDMTVDNTSFTTTEIDTAGYAYLQIVCAFGNVPANMAALAVTESDTTGSNHANVTGLIVGTSNTIAGATSSLPAASGGDGGVWIFDIDLRGRKRFIDLTATAGNGSATPTEMCALAILSRAQVSCETATERGAAQILRV
jgi:hypothetical protein